MSSGYYYGVVKRFIESKGVEVIDFFDLPENIVGRCFYEEKTIAIDCPTQKMALFVLIHEAGHWISYIRNQNNIENKFTKMRREILAFLYGWAIIKHLNIPISKKEWSDEEYESLMLYLEEEPF